LPKNENVFCKGGQKAAARISDCKGFVKITKEMFAIWTGIVYNDLERAAVPLALCAAQELSIQGV